tara:strand:- start:873 stop:1784 length:912 start_codon:yes stop_codon:yes gene_type:complete
MGFKNMKKKINIGLIGYSDGNGHPFSWSAIVNGFNQKYLNKCPFPIIREYLSEEKNKYEKISEVNISHIWTQDNFYSKLISDFAYIPNIVENYYDMIDNVDAVMLARDDFENHLYYSLPFIEAGIPIYIDKPIANSMHELKNILSRQIYKGQVFSHSALRYAKEFNFDQKYLSSFGTINEVIAKAPKDWSHYSIHIIEPVVRAFDLTNNFKLIGREIYGKKGKILNLKWDNLQSVKFITTGENDSEISIEINGTNKSEKIIFQDTYNAFKSCIIDFISRIGNKSNTYSEEELGLYVKLIETGI